MKAKQLSIAQVKSVPCPLCGAQSGQDCRFSTTGESRDGTHMVRKHGARRILGECSVSLSAAHERAKPSVREHEC
jgi:hypothetical protein